MPKGFVVQLVAGVINVVLLAPVWMQMLHLLLADASWIALVLLAASAMRVTEPQTVDGVVTAPQVVG